MWIVGAALFLGLPDYYAQSPGQVPAFYKSLPRRKIVLVCLLIRFLLWLLLTANDIVVLLRSLHPKLLALCPLRTKLALSLVQQTHTLMDDYCNGPNLLHRHLGHCVVDTGYLVETTCLVCADIRHWTRRPEMVSNALVDFEYWVVCALGRESGG